MPSRAEMRVPLEHVLRAVVVAALAAMLWQSLRDPGESGGETLRARGLGELADWSSLPTPPAGIQPQLDSVPKPHEREWLGALAGAGSSVTWSGDLPAAMIDAQPIASPTGGTKVLVAAPRGSSVVIRDDVGPLDTVQAHLAGVTLALGSVAGELTAGAGGSTASTVQRDSVVLKKVLVIGSAGWEGKFVVVALEEAGWTVDALIRIAPGVDVTQGSAAVIDTSRYSAVIALDNAASPFANRIIEFARTGGGVVLTPKSASVDALAAVRAGTVGRAPSAARAIQAGGSPSLATLALATIESLSSDALPIERRAGAMTVAARRISVGRAIQLSYEDTWRWRMGGGDGAVGDHRVWWTEVVSSVAYAALSPRISAAAVTDEAPVLGLVTAVKKETLEASAANSPATRSDWSGLLYLLVVLGLASEVASRRLRTAS